MSTTKKSKKPSVVQEIFNIDNYAKTLIDYHNRPFRGSTLITCGLDERYRTAGRIYHNNKRFNV